MGGFNDLVGTVLVKPGNLLRTRYDGEIRINQAEIEEGRWWRISELNKSLGSGLFAPAFEVEFKIMKERGIM